MSISDGANVASNIRSLIQTMINHSSQDERDVALKELTDALDEALVTKSDNEVAICKVHKGHEICKNDDGTVKYERHYSRARLPEKAHSTDSGFDAYVCFDDETIRTKYDDDETKATITIPCDPTDHSRVVPLGISIDIPDGYEIQCRGRSSCDSKNINIRLGTCDEGYAGIYKAIVSNGTGKPLTLKHGQKICQLVVAKRANAIMEWAKGDISTETSRGDGGFGSTGIS